MKLALREHEDHAAGISNEIAISFQANAVAFYAQISGLAKDKIGYPIRELNTNAWDATRDRWGNDIPAGKNFECFLPTSLKPEFRVRDYGYGMSPEQMREVYAQMYASTKRDSNTEVGGWGLGRFSGFAYLISDNGAASYTVISRQGGRKSTYVVSLNRDGAPVMRQLADEPNDEETGLEVSFPVRREDIHVFIEKARYILWSFHPRPRVFPDPNWGEPEVTSQGENWTAFKSRTVPFNAPHVRMGCVMYPIELGQVGTSSRFLESSDVVLFEAPIGGLSVTLSREALAYDDRTKETLRSLITAYEQAYLVQLQEKISRAETYFQACKIFRDETGNLGYGRQARLYPLINWRGMHLKVSLDLDEVDAKACRLTEHWSYREDFRFERATIRPEFMFDAIVAIEHNPSYSYERLYACDLVGKHVLWVRCKRADLDAVLAELGDPDYIVLDDAKIDKTPRDKARRTIRKRRTCAVNADGAYMRTQDVDMAAGGIFIHPSSSIGSGWGRRRHGEAYKVTQDRNAISWSDLNNLVKICVELEIIETGTPLLIRTDKDQLGDNWVWLGDKIKRKLKRKVNARQYTGLNNKTPYDLGDMRHIAESYTIWDFSRAPEDIRQFNDDVKALHDSLSGRGRAVTTTSDKAVTALRYLGETVEMPEVMCPIERMRARYTDLLVKYPLFEMIVDKHHYYNRREAQPTFDHYFDLLGGRQNLTPVLPIEEEVIF